MATQQIFERIGGSFQYQVGAPDDLREVLALDPALWAALCAPVEALNGKGKFLGYLDADGNGLIRIDDVHAAIRLLLTHLKTLDTLRDAEPELAIDALSDVNPAAQDLAAFAARYADELAVEGMLQLDRIGAKLASVAAGALKGDGILTAAAVAGSDGAQLFADILKISGGVKDSAGNQGVNAAQLDKFIADARAFLAWAQATEQPLFRGGDPVAHYAVYHELKAKIDEFFSFCELLQLDEANAGRFRLDPAKLPELNIHDPAAVRSALAEAPLAAPSADAVLLFDGRSNPTYREELGAFAAAFGLSRLSSADWPAIKADFAPYEAYLAKAQGDNIGAMGQEKLRQALEGAGEGALRDLFDRDGRLGALQSSLRKLETLILFKQNLMEFVRNFVNFDALFDPERRSLLQAGKLIMDGRTFALTLRIRNVADHKKIAVRSNLCMLYLELDVPGTPPGKMFVVAAVTDGDLSRIYVGKPAFFIDVEGKHFSGRVVDVVEGPISFSQTLFAPFRRLGDAVGSKIQKLTDFSGVEKKLETSINTGAPAAPPPPAANQPTLKNFLNNGSMMLLAGGLSLAAVGAAAGVVVRSISSTMATISAMSWWSLGSWVVMVLLLVFVPLSINAYFKLRKRNLTLFLEAAGWAVNLPMRLSAEVSRFFSYTGRWPEGAVLKYSKLNLAELPVPSVSGKLLRRRGRRAAEIVMVGGIVILVLLAVWLLHWR